MRTVVKGKNIEVPERVRRYAERKFSRLERLLDDRSDAVVELSVEQHRSTTDSNIVDVTLSIDGTMLRSHAAGASFQAGIDQLVDKIERRAVHHKDKPRLRSRPVEEKHILSRIADGTSERGHERRIVKIKRFAIEPMFEEDAVREMEELGHSFFVFVDASTERLSVLYRRTDGDYGLIEPTIGGQYSTGGNGRDRRGRSKRPTPVTDAPRPTVAGATPTLTDATRRRSDAAAVRPGGRRQTRGS
jgi:putative sigma-54 modulation protein